MCVIACVYVSLNKGEGTSCRTKKNTTTACSGLAVNKFVVGRSEKRAVQSLVGNANAQLCHGGG